MTHLKSRLAISNIAWKPEDTENVYQLLQKRGIINLEIAPPLFLPNSAAPYDEHASVILKAKKEAEDFSLNLVSMQSLLFGSQGLHLFEGETSRNQLLDYCKKSVDFASVLGIGNLVFGSPKNRIIPETMSAQEARVIADSFFNNLGDYAIKSGTCIGLEANSKAYGCNFLSNTKDAVAFIQELNNDGIKLNFDLSTFILENEDTNYLNHALSFATHVHISVPYLNAIYGFETEIHKKLKEALMASSYNGFVSIEMKAVQSDQALLHITRALNLVYDNYF